MSETRRQKRIYTDEFKQQIVNLYNSGKSRTELVKEYDLTPSALANWITYFNKSGSFRIKDNKSEEERKLLELEKEIKQLKMENDILKQAALIMGRK